MTVCWLTPNDTLPFEGITSVVLSESELLCILSLQGLEVL